VVCVDVDVDKIARLQRDEIPIYEPGLEALVRSNRANGRLEFSTDAVAAIAHAQVIFIAVGTPPDEDGSADLSHVLTVARTMLNLLCPLSGIATLTARWVDAVAGTGARIRDTRKTTPGLRALEKYAVRCGGGVNHRMGLWDAALVKDNHVAAAGGVAAAFRLVRKEFPDITVEVECDTVAQVREAVDAGADLILLDNMSLADLRTCVELAPGTVLEASGGLSLASAHDVAATGVTYLSVGALTHSAPILDLGMDLRGDPSEA
jgi:nicotinate-nucleotide pyrophosphorylase (carboxylating)